MLEPAIAHKEELLAKFAKEIYSEKYFYYMGYAYGHTLPEITDSDDRFQYAILDSRGEVVGYLGYYIDPSVDSISRFGLYSFGDKPHLVIGRDLFEKMEELYNNHHRLEWRVIDGNPVIKSYDKFCKKHKGQKVCFHDVCLYKDGSRRNDYVYEVINPNK